MNVQMKYGIAGLLIGGLIVWLVTGATLNSNKTGMMKNSGNFEMASANIDAHFIEQMIPHHEDAITMAKLALTKAKRPEVKKLAEEIIESQGKEITQMKNWYQNWYGKEVPENPGGMMGKNSGMHGGMMGDESDMTNLEQASDFDKAFVEEMIPHHQMAVMMATMLKSGTERQEMKQLAENIITAQNTEINQMRGWLKSW